jgi:hypothetical protein
VLTQKIAAINPEVFIAQETPIALSVISFGGVGAIDDVDIGNADEKIMEAIENDFGNHEADEAQKNEKPKFALLLGRAFVRDVLKNPKDRENIIDDHADHKASQSRNPENQPLESRPFIHDETRSLVKNQNRLPRRRSRESE